MASADGPRSVSYLPVARPAGNGIRPGTRDAISSFTRQQVREPTSGERRRGPAIGKLNLLSASVRRSGFRAARQDDLTGPEPTLAPWAVR